MQTAQDENVAGLVYLTQKIKLHLNFYSSIIGSEVHDDTG